MGIFDFYKKKEETWKTRHGVKDSSGRKTGQASLFGVN
jgi:hypothetical protein